MVKLVKFVKLDELVNEAINVLSDKNLSKEKKIAFVEKIALENEFNFLKGDLEQIVNDYVMGIRI